MDVADLIARLDLAPHPEGGFYRETFRSTTEVQTPRGPRAASTAIWYLLDSGERSALHRVASEEVWHHYAGALVTLLLVDDAGPREVRLGALAAGAVPQVVVPAGVWQAARCDPSGPALCGCTVAPGFDFADFEMATAADLRTLLPDDLRVEWA